jgi:hypothetical protein
VDAVNRNTGRSVPENGPDLDEYLGVEDLRTILRWYARIRVGLFERDQAVAHQIRRFIKASGGEVD